MNRFISRAICTVLAAVLLGLATGVIDASLAPRNSSDVSSAFAAPGATPTYVSELGPAVSRPPRRSGLPSTGTGAGESIPWALIAGMTLGVLGAGLMHAGLSGRKLAHG